jgi:ribosomal protein L11 methyltransferase
MMRLAVRCRPEQAEIVLAELAALAPNGFEEERGDGYVEFAIYGAQGELPDLGTLEATAGPGTVEVDATEIPDDWADRWQDFHQPLLVAERIWVRPSWAPAREETIDVIVEPGRAFGTGAHSTTRLCIELLAVLAEAGEASGPLLDLGTGSGVLAIVAAKLGWDPVHACDHEPASLESTAANAAANGVEVQLERVNLRERLPEPAPTVVANLTAPLLREVATRMGEAGVPERMVCSGLLTGEAEGVAAAFGVAGLAERERRVEGDWAALRLERVGGP